MHEQQIWVPNQPCHELAVWPTVNFLLWTLVASTSNTRARAGLNDWICWGWWLQALPGVRSLLFQELGGAPRCSWPPEWEVIHLTVKVKLWNELRTPCPTLLWLCHEAPLGISPLISSVRRFHLLVRKNLSPSLPLQWVKEIGRAEFNHFKVGLAKP